MASFQLDEYPWQADFWNDTKLKLKAFNYIQRIFIENLLFKQLSDIIFPSLPDEAAIPCFKMTNLQLYVLRPISKCQLGVAVWRYLSVVTQPILNFLFCNCHFPINLGSLATKSR